MGVAIASLVNLCCHLDRNFFAFCSSVSDVLLNVGGYSITSSLLRCQLECKGFVLRHCMKALP